MSYYKIIDGQKYDRQLLEAAEEFVTGKGDGRISYDDALTLFKMAQDRGVITRIEKNTLAYIRDHFAWTSKAQDWFQEQVEKELSVDELVEKIVRDEFQFAEMQLFIDEEEVRRQIEAFPTKIDLGMALRTALNSFFRDDRSPESPWKLIQEVEGIYEKEDIPASKLEEVEAKRQAFFNTGVLRLIPIYNPDSDEDLDFNPPEGGEPIAENWVFSLYLPELSDHVYWAIVDRQGKKEVYNYGFN